MKDKIIKIYTKENAQELRKILECKEKDYRIYGHFRDNESTYIPDVAQPLYGIRDTGEFFSGLYEYPEFWLVAVFEIVDVTNELFKEE